MEQVQLQLQFKVAAALVFFSILPFKSSSPYTPPDPYYLLNCGSSAPSTNPSSDDNRAFLPDTQVSPPTGKHISVGDTTSSTLYAAAMVFTDTSSYEFDINRTKTHMVRLHFRPLTTAKYDLSAAVFNVSANDEFNLLSNFSATNTTTTVKKEYFINVGDEKIRICFTPINELAFVSAIEVFSIPDDIIQSSNPSVVWPSELKFSVWSQALETLYRINVGGSLVTPSNDSMWRTWNPDNDYLASGDKSNLMNLSANSIKYDSGGSTEEIAPYNVYDTCRSMSSSNSNITWTFEVSGHATHLIRLHFCDITQSTLHELSFNVYINDQIAFQDFKPGDSVDQLATPFYKDCTTDSRRLSSRGKWLIRVSIGRGSMNGIGGILNGLEIFKLVPGSEQHKRYKKPSGLIVPCIVVGGFSLLSAAALLLFLLYRRRNRLKSKESAIPAANSDVSQRTVRSVTTNMNLELHITLSQIKSATKNFDESLVIGAGGFGKVYKGVLRDGGATRTRVAIKRASQRSRQGFPEFETEIHVLSGIRHRHLVSLIGYCQEHSEMILVYEFMSKGTLRDHLYNSDLPSLSWKKRLEICIGSARGLHYLHSGLAHPIIHRDVKSSNILLDDDFTGKVSDFGLSRVVGRSVSESHVSTGVKGSFGYFDPEYVRTQQLTTKSDVYSFGVVLLEALCARPVIEMDLPSEEINLADWAMSWHKQGLLWQTIDPRLVGEINPNSLRVFGQVAEKCLEECGADRPTMADVVWNLEYALQLQETEMAREPYEDSTGCATELPLPPVIGRWPSISNVVTINSSVARDTESENTASQVFSQFMTSEGR
ncbi:putative receptor-like protein kinase [Acorus calamus]|uniref:non-specific serine/threonine protein kinase n=1 Tax=Acorus calamus TaxID=4465 RepID=A0AAV9CCN7_ACOCL|nr:putative receptor-like protein kinase [Acorus calamus]